MRKYWNQWKCAIQRKTKCLVKCLQNQDGMGTVEVILIVAVLVMIALLFRNFIVDLAQSLFDQIEQNAESAVRTM